MQITKASMAAAKAMLCSSRIVFSEGFGRFIVSKLYFFTSCYGMIWSEDGRPETEEKTTFINNVEKMDHFIFSLNATIMFIKLNAKVY
jgi:hypothetical protein